ncbi:MAG: GWxTD domain-containing protein [Candidatus Aminicenantes bacterium]|nr:GWxTD domain-containing protein [Candidatus Aminicenantes bacterium]
MKKIHIIVVVLFVTLCLSYGSQKKIKSEDLPPNYRTWLEEEVVYIITPKEKDVFLQLENDREREMFINAFWKQRDPTPESPVNEFKEEHYRRIQYANKYLGRGSPTEGWRTDRGRIYIILGEPRSIERYENYTQIYPTIVWFYQGMSQYGLPDSFNVVFNKKYGAGDYELYSPMRDGPQSLLVHYFGDPRDYMTAYYQLKNIEPELAATSLSLIRGDTVSAASMTPSIASELLLSNIEVKPQKSIKDMYAEKLLKFKEMVEVEYTANYMDSASLVFVFRHPSGISYVDYLIEPDRLSVNQNQSSFYTTLEISGQISNIEGKTVFQFNRLIPIQFGQEQLAKMGSRPFSLFGSFPLVEGNYKLSLLMKNRVSKEFTSIEKDITIPAPEAMEMTPPLLAYHAKKIDPSAIKKAFSYARTQVYPVSKNEFSKNDTLYVFFQIPNITEEIFLSGKVQFIVYKGNEEYKRSVKDISGYSARGQILESFILKDFPTSYYSMDINILSAENKIVLSDSVQFSVTFLESIPRPFIYSEETVSPDDPKTDYILGGQMFNQEKYDEARQYLEKAHSSQPQSLLFAEGYSRLLFQAEDYQGVIDILKPFAGTTQKEYKFLKLLGDACQNSQKYEEAIQYYRDYLDKEGANLEVLNAAGISYYYLGKMEEALATLEKSLEINPDQEHIKKLVSSIRRKK